MHWRCLSCSSLSFVRCILCKVFIFVTSDKKKWFMFVFEAVNSDNLNYLNYRLEGNFPQTCPASTSILLYLLSSNTALLTALRPLLPLLSSLLSQSPPAHLDPDSAPLIICAVLLLPRAYQPWKAELPFNNPAKYFLCVHHYTKSPRLKVPNLSAVETHIRI